LRDISKLGIYQTDYQYIIIYMYISIGYLDIFGIDSQRGIPPLNGPFHGETDGYSQVNVWATGAVNGPAVFAVFCCRIACQFEVVPVS